MITSRWWIPVLVGLSTTLTAGPLSAEEGWSRTDWIFRAGVTRVDPRSTSLTLPSSDRVVVDADNGVLLEAAILFRERWGLELFLTPNLKHSMRLKSSSGVADFGETEQLLEILSIQHHLNPAGRVRPYLGVGVAYAEFNHFSPAGIDLDRSFGPALQAGVDVSLTPRWFLNLSARWADVDSGVVLSGTDLGSARIDPMIYSVSVGFRLGEPSWTPLALSRARNESVTSTTAHASPPPPTLARARVQAPLDIGSDADSDGVGDRADRCPGTLKDLRVDAYGCE